MADIRFLTMPRFRAFDDNGDPLGGGKVYVYAAGTSTKISTWQDALKGSKNTNPVILDSEGYADIFFDQNAKIVLDDSNDVQQWSLDNVSPLNAQTVTGRFNLIPNGSFELDGDGDGNPDDWTITLFNSSTSTVELDDTEVVDGVQSLKFVSQGDGGGSATSETFGVPNGGNISLSFWIKSSVAGVRNLVEIEYLDKDSQAVSTATAYDEDTSNPTTLTQQVFTDTVPGAATQARVKLTGCDQSDSTSGTTWFDFVQLTTQSYIFTGTAGEVTASASELNTMDGITASTDELNKADESSVDNGVFLRAKFIGEVFAIQDDVTGVNAPDNTTSVKFVQLTAGLTGSGQYNEGLLTNESTSGSSPKIVATAEISHSGSPMDGQTVRLINTEERFLRAGNAGTTQDDQMQRITGNVDGQDTAGDRLGFVGPTQGAFSGDKSGSGATIQGGGGNGNLIFDSADSPDARTSSTTDGETRVRNLGITYYMRIA